MKQVIVIKPGDFLFHSSRLYFLLFFSLLVTLVLSLVLMIVYFSSLQAVKENSYDEKNSAYVPSSIHKSYLVTSLAFGVVTLLLFVWLFILYARIFGFVWRTPTFFYLIAPPIVALSVLVVDIIFLLKQYNRCPAGSYANTSQGQCVPGCRDSSDCPAGSTCVNGICCDTSTHFVCDDGSCCDQECVTFQGKSFCCADVCVSPTDPLQPPQCCGAGTTCDVSGGGQCVATCGSLTCLQGEYCAEIPGISAEDASGFILSPDQYYDEATETLYACVPNPDSSECTPLNRSKAIPVAIRNFYPCYDANKDEMTQDLYESILASDGNTFDDVGPRIMNLDQNKPYSTGGFLCGGAPTERAYQTVYSNCDVTQCLKDANTSTIGIGSVRDGDGTTLYCNQVMRCNNELTNVDVSGGHSGPSELDEYYVSYVSDNESGIKTMSRSKYAFQKAFIPPPPPPGTKDNGGFDMYQASCTALPNIPTDAYGSCNGTILEGSSTYACKLNDATKTTGYVINPQGIMYSIGYPTNPPMDWNAANVELSQCSQTINCFDKDTYDELLQEPDCPIDQSPYYVNNGTRWKMNVCLFQRSGGSWLTSNCYKNPSFGPNISLVGKSCGPNNTWQIDMMTQRTLKDGDEIFLFHQNTETKDPPMALGEKGSRTIECADAIGPVQNYTSYGVTLFSANGECSAANAQTCKKSSTGCVDNHSRLRIKILGENPMGLFEATYRGLSKGTQSPLVNKNTVFGLDIYDSSAGNWKKLTAVPAQGPQSQAYIVPEGSVGRNCQKSSDYFSFRFMSFLTECP